MQRLAAHRACVCWVAKRFKLHFAECGPTTEMHDYGKKYHYQFCCKYPIMATNVER